MFCAPTISGDYKRHQCSGPGCTPCTDLIPGCENARDGLNPYPGRLLTKFHLTCKGNKTASVEICRVGVFDPIQQRCTTDIDPSKKIAEYVVMASIKRNMVKIVHLSNPSSFHEKVSDYVSRY